MDHIKVNEVTPVNQPQQTQEVKKTGEEFKFTLASAIQDEELQEKLTNLMSQIDEQGKKISEHMDIRDMK